MILTSEQKNRRILFAILFILASIFLVIAIPRLDSDLNIKSFFREKLTEILVFLSVGLVLRAFLTKSDKKHLHFIADAIIIASTIGLMVEAQHLRESYERVSVEGIWAYEVQNSNGVITHGGISTIRQGHDGELFISGRRKYKQHCEPKGCKGTERELEIIDNEGLYWKTDFAVLHGDETKVVDFVYSIIIDNAEFKGYCRLFPDSPGKEPQKLEGTYTHLAPGTLKGDIHFLKMPNKGDLGRQEALTHINKAVQNSKGVVRP